MSLLKRQPVSSYFFQCNIYFELGRSCDMDNPDDPDYPECNEPQDKWFDRCPCPCNINHKAVKPGCKVEKKRMMKKGGEIHFNADKLNKNELIKYPNVSLGL